MKPNDNREHWSASSLKELCSCPLRFKLHRIDHVHASHRSPSLVLGGTYHLVLANALTSLRENEPVKKEALVRQFKSFWKTELEASGPPIKWTAKVTAENQRELGIEMVKAWYDQGLPLFRDTEIVTIEMPFRVPIINPTTGEVTERPLDGFIDCIVRRPDGGATVIDHKTAGQQFSDVEIALDLQATGYVLAARELGYQDVRFEFHVMSKNRKAPKLSVLPVPRDDDDIARLHWVASQAEKLLDAEVFMPSTPGWQCAGCAYAHACRKVHVAEAKPAREAVPVA